MTEDQSERKNTLPINDKEAFKNALKSIEKLLEQLGQPPDLAIEESLILKKQEKKNKLIHKPPTIIQFN